MIRTLLIGCTLLVSAPAVIADDVEVAITETVAAETIVANVNGMVCDFCAQAVNKVFKKEEAVEAVDVSLDDGTITITCKPGETLDDARVEKLVKKSGYALVSIDRGDAG